MSCLIVCLIWIGGYGYNDQCPAQVEVTYSTSNYHYVKVIQGPTTTGDQPKIEIKIWQRIAKPDCSSEKK